ncbi:FLYWCH-type domain-containing protein [Aphis craccivora]|uniref:FLYWCH-type domain-containing protein n=1 Tax=Aphis craccivora TaxID=307492 RepID=A0A6G0VRZ9_APHCR|nr:FLYWCH-type domain-containing protein [Aphis craccivora]
MAVAPDTAVSFIFSDYILENYIDSNCNFPPILWAFEPNGNPKMTNNAESFHKHYNSQFYTPHPHIHQVIYIFMQIQSETDLKINSIKNNVMNYKIKETVHKEEYLQDMWNKYKNKTINRLTYIKNIGNKFHHTNLI